MPLMKVRFNDRIYVFETDAKTVHVMHAGSNEELYTGRYNDIEAAVLALDKRLNLETRTKLNGRTYVHNREAYTVKVYEGDKDPKIYHDVTLADFGDKVRQIDAELSDKVISRGEGTFEYKSAGYVKWIEYSNHNLRIAVKCINADAGIKEIDKILRAANVIDRDG